VQPLERGEQMLTPNVPFVPINIIISQYRPVLVLKRHFAMMSVLVFNVTHNAINMSENLTEKAPQIRFASKNYENLVRAF
jgi:hypothetical protein